MIKHFVTFFVVASLFLWMPTVTVKKDLRGMANTIVEIVELVEEYQGNSDLDEKIVLDYSDEVSIEKFCDYKEDIKFISSQTAFEVFTPPPDKA